MPDSAADQAELDRIAGALDGCLIALDFDGTLAPFTTDPARSAPAPGAVDALRGLARAGARVAIVTGRDAATALRLSGLGGPGGIDDLVVSGLHGAQTLTRGRLRTRAEPDGLAPLRESLPALLATVDAAAWLEDKQLSLVVHTRRSADPAKSLQALRPKVVELAEAAGLVVHPGHLVLEIRMPGVDKGDAVAQLLRADPTAALFAGDDHGDLPAIRAVNAWGAATGRPAVTIAVGPLAELREQARLGVADPDALVAVLAQLVGEAVTQSI